ncbi:uncharacterized protein PV06_04091 [Exophiala oligosperma]|uniref:Uncharacterized protein n=1 Tax=Exophiala oligosperma TaxID=215243 RepID=A0A0D2DRW0_9EURO|nr:uncharacterized protein PV06_04091 [Exophiala oligosperma]KIW45728.1 hypothetical protein PV06_04091 [Exophiala oligosperma]
MLVSLALALIPAIVVYTLIKNYFLLTSSIPGPFVARFTDAYRALLVYRRRPHEVHLALHKKHGDLVRLGPNYVSVTGSRTYVPQIYGIGKGLVKSDFYSVFQNVVNGRRAASLVAETDESAHAKSKRLIAHAYSLSTLVEYEGLVERTTVCFLDALEERFATTRGATGDKKSRPSQSLDLARYLQFFAFDVIGELTFSRRLGFIESGTDVDNIMAAIGANFSYFSVLGQMPWLDETLLGKNPIYVKYFRKSVSSPILIFAQRLLKERLEDLDGQDNTGGDDKNRQDPKGKGGESYNRPDFLTRFLKVRKEQMESHDEALSDGQILSYLFMNINAGSDTIASTLRAIFYHLLKNPTSLTELQSELDAAARDKKISVPCPTWVETQENLPFLCAVIKEGLRMNPALSLPLERVVPAEGLTLRHEDNTTTSLPPGTIIGINPWVFQRSTDIFGKDAERWNPTRWLTPEEKSTKSMEHSLLAFGAGKRSCLGKNVALLELHKLIPAMLLKFNMTLTHPDREWKVENAWALNQTDIEVNLSLRNPRRNPEES